MSQLTIVATTLLCKVREASPSKFGPSTLSINNGPLVDINSGDTKVYRNVDKFFSAKFTDFNGNNITLNALTSELKSADIIVFEPLLVAW